MKRTKLLVCITLVTLLITGTLLNACTKTEVETVTLHFASFDPPNGFASPAQQAFADELEKRTDGKYKVEFAWGGAMGSTEGHYDLVKDGVADIAYFLAPLTPGLFPMSDIISLPWRLPNANVSVTAFWEFYKAGYLDDEYSDVVPIFPWAGSGQSIFSVNPINTLADMNGVKVISHSEMNNEILSECMGAVPMFIPHGEMYGAIEKGTADALFLVWEGIAPFNLQDVMPYAVDLTFGNIGCVVAMNKGTFNGLPKDVQDIIRDIAEDTLLPKTIEGYNNAQLLSKDLFAEAGGQVIEWSAADMAQLETSLTPIWEQWIAQAEANGMPGREAVNKMYSILQNLGVAEPAIGYTP